jgi:ATP-dependent DNA helicase RecG
MAPTELLAEQHHRAIARLIEGMDVRIELLTGERLRGRERERVYAELAHGGIDIAVGTHALIQESVDMPRLGLGIIDEQHRFGVLQRAAVRGLGVEGKEAPDILLMTATPIPRTLSMSIYGDLEVSLLDELPPGRQPVRTHVAHESERGRVYATVRREVTAGRQAYVVYPLVESSDKLELRDATTMASELARTVFPKFRVGLLHGKMKADEKEGVMRRFRDGDLQILVSTTVVEVGVDVPNATVMVVEHAERFGLSQLHQLRGRVGRGQHPSICLLVSSRQAEPGDGDRLAVMRDSNDGFAIAEADLRLRGPGEFLGTRQSGLPDFRVANLLRDTEVMVAARNAALEWLEIDPDLSSEASARLRAVLKARWSGRLGLAEIG